MRYIQHNLLENEKLVYAVRPHWVVFSWSVWALVIAFFFWFFLRLPAVDMVIYDGLSARDILAGSLVVIGAYWWVKAYIYYKTSEYGVTDKRVLIKTGWIERDSLELMLDKVEGVLVSQSIVGRIFSYGMITIVGTGGTKDSYPFIPHPLRFRKEVQQAVENFEERFRTMK